MKILKHWLPTRERTQPVTTIVLHATDGASAWSSVSWLRQIGLSYHYIIDRGGEYIKTAPLTKVAFHAGKSVGPNGKNVNDYSIGIAFANRDSKREQLTKAAVDCCRDIVADIVRVTPSIKYITMHRVISPGRKSDPLTLSALDMERIAGSLEVWTP